MSLACAIEELDLAAIVALEMQDTRSRLASSLLLSAADLSNDHGSPCGPSKEISQAASRYWF
jgi:hypothetical protein